MGTQNTWPYTNKNNESTIEINKRMIHKLIERKEHPMTTDAKLVSYMLGKNFERKRYEAGLTYTDIRNLTGLDTAFLCIFASGKALTKEIMAAESVLRESDLLDKT
jgi:hypothetical protein